ncbi:MAG: conjugal transfer protein TraM [Tatlockia sp.]|nr:conjugal transfer protein TraM [Tatlockia sp.]
MQNSTETLIQEIALKNGVGISCDDPLLILQTINAQLMKDNAKAQHAMLNQFKEEMAGIALRWESDAKDKAERILNASLLASKESMTQCLQTSASITAALIKKEVEESLSHANHSLRNSAQGFNLVNLVASAMTFLAACVVIIGLFFH